MLTLLMIVLLVPLITLEVQTSTNYQADRLVIVDCNGLSMFIVNYKGRKKWKNERSKVTTHHSTLRFVMFGRVVFCGFLYDVVGIYTKSCSLESCSWCLQKKMSGYGTTNFYLKFMLELWFICTPQKLPDGGLSGLRHIVSQIVEHLVGSEVLKAVVMKNCTFWDITPCSPLKIKSCFRETCHLHLQGQRLSQARNRRERR
jgi:hypothetical protein